MVAFLFELMKYGFQLYIGLFPSYQIVYGAMALLLIFLLWVYLSWSAVLFGAILASELYHQPTKRSAFKALLKRLRPHGHY